MARRKRNRYWIQKAIKREGSLRRWAKEHGFLTERGTIDLRRALKYAKKKGLTQRIRQINLAKTLRRLRRKRR
jgi:hypothetical protein